MPMTEIMVAWGIIFFGFRDYSPYMAEDSNPTQDQKAKNRPIPAVALGILSAALNALTGLTDYQDMPFAPPPCNRTATPIRSSTAISRTRAMPRTLEVN